MKTAIIGSVDLMPSSDVDLWAKSIRSTGYEDDIILIAYRIDEAEYSKLCEKYGIDLYVCNYDENGQPLNLQGSVGQQTQHHIWRMRFFHMYQLLSENPQYTHIINSDVRDVIFQLNPNNYLKGISDNFVIAPLEGLQYQYESWNAKSMRDCFGEYVWEYSAKEFNINNCGTWAAGGKIAKWLALSIYTMSHMRQNPGDQPSFNLLVNGLLKAAGVVMEVGMDNEWACQCALTLEPSRSHLRSLLNHEDPVMGDDGIVRNSKNKTYVIVHQYDRVPGWSDKIRNRLNA